MALLVPDAGAYANIAFLLMPQGSLWELSDLAIIDDDIAIDQGLVTSGLLSMLVDARAEPEDRPPDPDDRRGYWADQFAAAAGDRSGSKLWLLGQRSQVGGAQPVAEQYAREALQWYLDDGIADEVNVAASIETTRLTLLVEIRSPTGDALAFRLLDLWSNTQIEAVSANTEEEPGSADLALVLDDLTPIVDRVVYKVLLALGDELTRVSGRAADLVEESDPRTADELLPEWEKDYGLLSTGTDQERRDRLLSAILKSTGVRPVDFQVALAPILGFTDPNDVEVIETSRATAIAAGDDRIIYQFYIYRDPALPGVYDIVDAQRVIDEMAHSHTRGVAIESDDFLCDDPFSLCDRDILGI
jgi:phage gp46-like protein/uncharacterized protein YmfQ (DUF2313 family)